jgi:hypothetical protein
MAGLPPSGHPRLDLPVSLGALPPPRGSDPLMSLGPSSGPHNSGPGMRQPNSNEKVNKKTAAALLHRSKALINVSFKQHKNA